MAVRNKAYFVAWIQALFKNDGTSIHGTGEGGKLRPADLITFFGDLIDTLFSFNVKSVNNQAPDVNGNIAVSATETDYTPADADNVNGFWAGLIPNGVLKINTALDKIRIVLNFDTTPTAASNKLLRSGAIHTALQPLATVEAVAATGTVLTFTKDSVYGSETTPETGGFSADLTGAKLGVTNLCIHNAPSKPTFAAIFHEVTGSDEYAVAVNNYIYFQHISATRINYTICQ